MNPMRRWRGLGVASLCLGLAGLTGCQTWMAGQTLPSGWYLQHRPQYFPSDVDTFPLQRELATMEAQNALAAGGAVPPPPLGPAPAGPAPAPGPR